MDCCGAYLTGVKLPTTPEQLMRSRYTAYATCNIDYIVKTMYGKPLDGFNQNDVQLWAKEITWLKLEVLDSKLENEKTGFVEFKAYYLEHEKHVILHEISKFQRKDGKWFYTDGTILD